MSRSVIRASTRLCGLIGDPVAHSLSPPMQNAAFAETGIDAVYLAFRVRRERLGRAIEGLRELKVLGLNVTIPHKSAVMPFLDEVDPLTEEIGAVNTIICRDGSLVGTNTDRSGFGDALSSSGFVPAKGMGALLIGAGDAAKAVGHFLAGSGMTISVLNRDRGKGERLALELGRLTEASAVTHDELEDIARNLSLIVNCTPMGMVGFPEGPPIDAGTIRPGMTVVDIVYNPMETPLLVAARDRGAKVVHGHEMLLGQGARSFEAWTGGKAPRDIMRRALLSILEGA